jgi:hypothetical protein
MVVEWRSYIQYEKRSAIPKKIGSLSLAVSSTRPIPLDEFALLMFFRVEWINV